jgi:hypothetical protein
MMKKLILLLLVLGSSICFSQVTGDTIVMKAFKYGSATRDTAIQFPTGSTTYEKIIMKYNMRCKNGLVSTSSNKNLGCGEWDYSCNTYIADSGRIELDQQTHPDHIITNFSGNTFYYSTTPLYDYYNYTQTSVTLNSIVSETQYTVGTGTSAVPDVLKADQKSGRTQLLFTAAELNAAGFSAGNIDGLIFNISNAGGTANFFNLGIRQTTLSALNAGTVLTTSFTNVYNSNHTFVNGDNRFLFHTPFNWNGTDNLIIDYSFTNTNPSTPIIFNGVNTLATSVLFANNNYALNFEADGHVAVNPTFLNSITTELTVSFWAFGNKDMMPANTSAIYAWGNNANERMLNIHLPWSDNNIYFDCGYSAGGFDRLNKVSTSTVQAGQWNHWAFTKNSNTGWMKIYLNGVLWTMMPGKLKPMSIMNMILGKEGASMNNNYKGKLNHLSIWNKELVLADVKALMNSPILPAHPYYSNLLAYYKMDEGTGNIINDTKNVITSTGTNTHWSYDRGNTLNRMFTESTLRPNIVFLRGNYSVTTTTLTVKDSIQKNPSVVKQYSITSNATVTPMTDDAVTLVSTTSLYNASTIRIYNGDTGILTATMTGISNGTITIVNLNYLRRHPYYIELMSFVTPYGINLDLGPNGKTWYFDVSDYAPLLKGKKRLLMTLGGEWQENIDIDFLFVVGTPPRTVLDCHQLWQGGARLGGSSIGSITSDSRFSVQTFTSNGAAKAFKMRSTITGHGSEGEFHQNGGLINHYFNINGGPNEFSWQITRYCATNPIYPQGGTWIYDRQGWCPGEYSLLKEYDITPYVVPGSTVTLDYNCSNPPVPSGDYRYIAAHQLVSYGAPNFGKDAAVLQVRRPGDYVEYLRENPMCSNPVVVVRNTGSVTINSIDVDYWLNSSSVKESFQWTGALAFMDTVSISLPIGTLWQNGLMSTNNRFNAELKKVNGSADDYAYNNKISTAFVLPDIITDSLTVEFKTNNMATENRYRLVDAAKNIVPGGSTLNAANTIYTDSYILNGCYTLIVEDDGEDGLQWWANTAQGAGFVRLKNPQGIIIKTFNNDFGKRFEYSFTTKAYSFAGIKENALSKTVHLYPNPAHESFELKMNSTDNVKVRITDMLGRDIELPVNTSKDKMIFDSSILKAGVYLVKITEGNESCTRKLVIN